MILEISCKNIFSVHCGSDKRIYSCNAWLIFICIPLVFLFIPYIFDLLSVLRRAYIELAAVLSFLLLCFILFRSLSFIQWSTFSTILFLGYSPSVFISLPLSYFVEVIFSNINSSVMISLVVLFDSTDFNSKLNCPWVLANSCCCVESLLNSKAADLDAK